MKKKFAILLLSLSLGASLSSCNKKLKEDLDELEKSVEAEKSKGQALQNEVNTLNGILIDSPLSSSYSTSNGSVSLTASGSYSFVYGSAYTQSLIRDLGNGSYQVSIWRGADLGTDVASEIEFIYSPATNSVSGIEASTEGYLSNNEEFYAWFAGTNNITHTVTVQSFSFTGRSISFTYQGSTTANYSNNLYSGQPMSLSLSYSGPMATKNYTAAQ